MSKLTLVIGNKNYSSWSLRPWIFMKENNIPFDEKKVLLGTPNTGGELLQYGSNSKVPVLLDDGFIVWDSLAILEYISDKYCASQGWPADEKARAIARSVSSEMHSSFFSIRNNLPMNCRKEGYKTVLSADTQKEILRIEKIWEDCLSNYGNSDGWLFGEYSIADAMFAPIALRFYSYAIELGEASKNYLDRVLKQENIKLWIKDGKNEKEIIEEAEI